MDYVPVFIANGFYKNKTDFTQQHVMWSKYTKFPKVDRYYNTRRLVRLRDSILIDMKFDRQTVSHHEDIQVEYDIWNYKKTIRERWNFLKNEPIQNAGELCYELRRITNSDISRIKEVVKIANEKNKVIVFYNYDYELDILKSADYGDGFEIAEWNGHKHQPIPETDKWIYLVQYNAGAEGWNCIQTDTIIFYSQNYSYKMMAQASGRIDRLNTPYTDLYYYHLKSKSSIDVAIGKSLSEKKKFNETKYCSKMNFEFQKAA
jgi:superfamily II DNA or RNA helicase